MPDNSITHDSIAKGQKLENMLKRVLKEIVTSLRKGGIDCYFQFNKNQGGRGKFGPDFLLVIHQENKNFYFYIEAKNNKDLEWSLANVKEKILKKFQSLEFTPNEKKSEIIKILIGHTRISRNTFYYLLTHEVLIFDTGELPLKTSKWVDDRYYEKLKGTLLFMILDFTDVLEYQSSKYVIEITDDRNLVIKKNNKEIESYKIKDLEGKGFKFRGPKLMDCFGVTKGSRDGIKIITPWKVTSSNPDISITRRKIGTGLSCIRIGKKKLRKHCSFR